ncbi:hypothetical protein [Colwellia sp. E2M01]|uniref:hypothetical protein n=1 Tax=Colwellia sp. E2M01 TaxID=2841561 RepID=UPI001C096ED8|nr:hypothetical protein [Colwellia sp. E2M01]MBU2869446.1 hypothetical protein [Colwellia sp. E2M01]
MLNQFVMQYKREYWENKQSFLYIPIAIFSFILGLFTLASLYFLLSQQLNFLINDEVIFGSQDVHHEFYFDGEKPNALQGFSKVEHTFEKLPSTIPQEFPELMRENDKLDKLSPSVHPYKKSIDNRIAHIMTAVDFMLFIFITIPFINSLLSDKRDKSVLFWRSMPVSHTKVILTKILLSCVLYPILLFAAIYVALGGCLLIITAIESSLSVSGSMAISHVFTEVFVNILAMFKSFAFKVVWFLPVLLLFGLISVVFANLGKAILLMIGFSGYIVTKALSQSELLVSTVGKYFLLGNETALNLKFSVIWGDYYLGINYEWFSYCILASVVITGLLILARHRQKF